MAYDQTVTFIVASAYWDEKNTIVTLTNLSVNTSSAVIGNINFGIENWVGGYPIGGQYSHVEGNGNYVIGYSSHAEGLSTQAIGQSSHAEGGSTQAIGPGSHAEGGSTQAVGVASHAEGESTQALGNHSHTEGYETLAGSLQGYLTEPILGGTCSLDVLYGNITSSFNIGDTILFDDTQYDNTYGIIFLTIATVGLETSSGPTILTFTDPTINTTSSTIIGNLTAGPETWAGGYPIGGAYSHAEGIGTITLGTGQHTSGKYNIPDGTSLFIVGNGIDNGNRSNAFKVTPSGSIVLPTIQSTEPAWDGTVGEMIFSDDGAGTYTMYVWLDGRWRSSSLA
jgi:hypothetical protein